ncbi:MAG: hypothetical protein NTW19_23740 [Planctomycetota bacterium]|nr:hypothetical protein [Planctomycetota bacterium]
MARTISIFGEDGGPLAGKSSKVFGQWGPLRIELRVMSDLTMARMLCVTAFHQGLRIDPLASNMAILHHRGEADDREPPAGTTILPEGAHRMIVAGRRRGTLTVEVFGKEFDRALRVFTHDGLLVIGPRSGNSVSLGIRRMNSRAKPNQCRNGQCN